MDTKTFRELVKILSLCFTVGFKFQNQKYKMNFKKYDPQTSVLCYRLHCYYTDFVQKLVIRDLSSSIYCNSHLINFYLSPLLIKISLLFRMQECYSYRPEVLKYHSKKNLSHICFLVNFVKSSRKVFTQCPSGWPSTSNFWHRIRCSVSNSCLGSLIRTVCCFL